MQIQEKSFVGIRCFSLSHVLAIGCLLVAVSASAHADDPAWASLAVYPQEITLATSADYQGIVVVATRADGVTLDVTEQAELAVTEASLASLEASTIQPLADGETTLVAKFAGLDASAKVTVTHAAEQRPVSYMLDVMPVFARAGCNSGSCHGAASGKDGFRLSLFGFDPPGDHFRITREQATRRINLAVPVDSLLMEKASGAVQHSGGKCFEASSKYYGFLNRWLADGAPSDAATAPQVSGLAIYPPAAVMQGEGATQRFIAVASYSDGTTRDVTDLARIATNNANSTPIDDAGLVTAGVRGESFITARFNVHTVGSQVLTLPNDLQFTASEEVPANYIDELVANKLNKLRIVHSPICTDEEFLRRVTIDVVGNLPTVEEYHAFLADESPTKRATKIDELLAKKEFSEIWAMKWAELLMVKTVANRVAYKPMFLYANWLANKIADNVPINEIVREILSSTGGTFSVPATNFYQLEPDTQKTAENVAQIFLGLRIQCAQCHNHIFDRWTMDDYYSFKAFFAQIGRKKGEDYRETIVFNSGGGESKNPVTNQVMAPKFLGGETPDVAGKDRRQVLADWIASPENPYFATSVANRVWAHYMGIGIVEPVDDIRVTNPASNPELFDELGKKLIAYNYDFKQLVRDICNSNAYQRSTGVNESNAGDLRNFSHAGVRRVQAEMLLDCISQLTETKNKFRGLPVGARAIHIADGKTSTYFLSTFGRAKRDTVCSCEVDTQPSLSQALHLINGPTIEGKIREGKIIEKALEAGKTPTQVLDDLTIRCLCRLPTEDERTKLMALIGEAEKPVAELQDAFWAILNSREFLFNH